MMLCRHACCMTHVRNFVISFSGDDQLRAFLTIAYILFLFLVAAQFYKGCSNSTVGSSKDYDVEHSKLPFSCIGLCIKEG